MDLYSYFDIGNIGMEFSSADLTTVDKLYITFPTIFIRDRESMFGISIQSSEFRLCFEDVINNRVDINILEELDYDLTFLETSIFWSPFKFDELIILGPFIDINLFPNSSVWYSFRTGIKYIYSSSTFKLFKNSFLPKELVLTSLDFEIGYSILEGEFYASISTDFSIIYEGAWLLLDDLFSNDLNSN